MVRSDNSRGGLEDSPYAFSVSKDGKAFISWRGRQVMILKDSKAKTFLQRMEGLSGPRQQKIMARITGDFKRDT
jgi:hypothetical protein